MTTGGGVSASVPLFAGVGANVRNANADAGRERWERQLRVIVRAGADREKREAWRLVA